jgi:peptidoglycan/LPS O-acetylase OafA/YrhL
MLFDSPACFIELRLKVVPREFVSQMNQRLEGHIPELDGIRAIAIWMVLLMHALFGFQNRPGALDFIPTSIAEIVGHGWLGVDLFFLLSGFLITGILLGTKERPHYFKNFYIRRFLRIMPLYFVLVSIWAFLYRGYGKYFLLSSVFGANLARLFDIRVPHGPGVLWSLAVEEHFYLLWPAIVLLLDRRKLLYLCAIVFLGSPILRDIYAAHGMSPETIYDLSWFHFDGLAAGAAMAIWAHSSYFDFRTARRLAGSLLAVLFLMSVGGAHFGLFGTKTVAAVALRYTQAYLFFGAIFILSLVYRGTIWTTFLRNRFMQLSGALSYCLYLVHLSVGDGVRYLITQQNFLRFGPTIAVLLRATLMLSASFGIAMLSRRYLEEPFLELKYKFTVRNRENLVAIPPAVEAHT